jgi:exodeoxyribonuclease-3
MAAELRLLTWNVNSVRARLDHVLTYLADHEPDVVCLQETKVEDKLFPKVPFLELGYQVHIHGSKGYAGVATLTKRKASDVHGGFREGPPDKACRILQLVVDGVRIYNLYCPNGTELGSDAFAHKLAWFRQLREELQARCDPAEPLVLCGDFNIAPDERDVYDVAAMAGRLHFTAEEHAVLAELREWGLTDCFRARHGDAREFSWFDYRNNSFARGEGLRIDHVYGTATMVARCRDVVHDRQPRTWESPTDHLPVTATFAAT